MSRSKSEFLPKKLLVNENFKDNVIGQMTDDLHLGINDILKKNWKVFRVSPIYNFNSKHLKLYGSKLCQELKGKRKFSLAATYKSSFTLDENLEINEKFSKLLQVEVRANEFKKVYLGYFVSLTSSTENTQDFISFPILLAQGKGQELSDIHSSLCKIFDCDIQTVTFSFHALITFFVKELESVPKDSGFSQDVLLMEYKIPGSDIKDSIKVTLMLKETTIALAVIIDSLRENLPGINNMKVILEFYKRILHHLNKVYDMDLSKAELHKIDLPYASLSADGQLKILSQDAASAAFFVLQLFTPLPGTLNI